MAQLFSNLIRNDFKLPLILRVSPPDSQGYPSNLSLSKLIDISDFLANICNRQLKQNGFFFSDLDSYLF